jgi:hypothetical protein
MKAPFRQVRLAACVDSARLSSSFSHMPSANVWSHINHIAGEWIGEVKRLIAGMKDPFDLSFEPARRFPLEGQPAAVRQEAAPGSFANFSPRAGVRVWTLILALARVVLRAPSEHPTSLFLHSLSSLSSCALC